MALGKYTTSERQIARRIRYSQSVIKKHENIIVECTDKLGGKYKGRSMS